MYFCSIYRVADLNNPIFGKCLLYIVFAKAVFHQPPQPNQTDFLLEKSDTVFQFKQMELISILCQPLTPGFEFLSEEGTELSHKAAPFKISHERT